MFLQLIAGCWASLIIFFSLFSSPLSLSFLIRRYPTYLLNILECSCSSFQRLIIIYFLTIKLINYVANSFINTDNFSVTVSRLKRVYYRKGFPHPYKKCFVLLPDRCEISQQNEPKLNINSFRHAHTHITLISLFFSPTDVRSHNKHSKLLQIKWPIFFRKWVIYSRPLLD